jgi:threonine dehydrogenase-like Zn-dependent dehydrogenase
MTVPSSRSWVLHGPGQISLEPVALPPLQRGWVRCRVLRFQLSVTDVLRIRGLLHGIEPTRRYVGHEFVARVIEVEPPAPATLLGQRVVCPPSSPCGSCDACALGDHHLCEQRIAIGGEGPGPMGEIIDLPGRFVLPVSDAVSDLAACCSQPAASSVANLVHGEMRRGARVLILGQGTMGLLLLQAARALGAARVLTTALRDAVRKISLELGAEDSLLPSDPKTPERIRRFDPDFVIDAAGGPQGAGLSGTSTLETAMASVRRYGTVLEISEITVPMTIAPSAARHSVRLVFGQMGHYYGLYGTALQMLGDGRLRCDPFVTHQINGLDRLPDALDVLSRRRETDAIQVQVVLDAHA